MIHTVLKKILISYLDFCRSLLPNYYLIFLPMWYKILCNNWNTKSVFTMLLLGHFHLAHLFGMFF